MIEKAGTRILCYFLHILWCFLRQQYWQPAGTWVTLVTFAIASEDVINLLGKSKILVQGLV